MDLDKSWIGKRGGTEYIVGVQHFINFVKVNANGQTHFPCPCTRCKNCRGHIDIGEISFHLLKYGMQQSYVIWRHHGEKTPIMDNPIVELPPVKGNNPRLNELIDNVYNVHTCGGDASGNIIVEEDYIGDDTLVEPSMQESKKYKKFRDIASEPLYPGCPVGKTTLSTIIELQNLKTRYGWTGTSVTTLLEWLKSLFIEDSNLPKNYPNMKNMIKDLGMECQTIHACRNGCILYRNKYEHIHKCPKCGASRYKLSVKDAIERKKKFKKEPAKFVKYFPIIPRLKRFFSIPWIGEAMTWHQKAKSNGDLMRHPCDSGQWNSVKVHRPEFAADARNLRLAISTDGFNPHGTLRSRYSCWPVILAQLNLPPSLCMKQEFSLLTLLISGPKGPGKNIDVFLEPLVEDLNELWVNGVHTWDAYTKTSFKMKAMLLWAVHDFPAYGNLSGCTVHGYKACPVCADDIDSMRLGDSSKVYYHGYRRFLKSNHKYRTDKRFNKTIEQRPPPRRLSGQEVEQKIAEIIERNERKQLNKAVRGKRKRASHELKNRVREDNIEDESTLAAPWSRRSILFDLPYWKFLEVRHNIDVMHTEKNVTEHLLNMLMDVKNKSMDGLQGRKEMKKLGVNKKLWIVENEETGKISMPKGSYALIKEEQKECCQTLKDLKLPTGFSSNLSNCVNIHPPELYGLKSHDYHVIMQHFLPLMFRHSFHKNKDLRIAIQRISLFFKILCAKVISKEELTKAKYALVEAMCILEKEFPPSFFVISVHCMIHLADEALSCGPVRFRWMYPFERLMKLYKEYTLNKRYVEGSIAEAYLVDEAVIYCMEYMPNSSSGGHKASRENWLDEDVDFTDEKPLEIGGTMQLNHIQFEQVRRWVLNRLADPSELSEWKKKYDSYCHNISTQNRAVGFKRNTTITEFIPWLCDELLKEGQTNTTLWRLANGPRHKVLRFKKYCVNGFIFSPASSNEFLVTQDSGVSMEAYSAFISGRKDKNPKEGKMTFYGIVREILELDYNDFKETVFYCDWVKVEDSKNGCKLNLLWNQVMVNLTKLKNKDRVDEDPFILAQAAVAVFYSRDQKDEGWHSVLNTPKKLTKGVDMVDIPNDYQSCLKDNPSLRNLLIFDD